MNKFLMTRTKANARPLHFGSAMITYLEVRNLAIVEELAIEPGPGLNVLTGETGAGKSLLIDSLEFLRGARGSTEMIRAGAEKMSAAAVFHLPAGTLDDLADGDEVIVKREISVNGRARVLVNGSPITVRELSSAMDAILEIHGQHDAQTRVAGQSARQLLDEFGNHDLDATRNVFREWRDAAEQFRELSEAQRDRALRLDLLRYQIDEISAAKLDPAEEDALRGERAVLAHAREIIEATSGAYTLVDDDESAAVAQVARALHLVQPLADKVADLRPIAAELQDVLYRLQESARTLSSLSESVRHDPKRLDEVEERLVAIERLGKKYGGSIDAVLAHLGAIQDEFERLNDYEANLDKLQRVERQRHGAYRKAAESLSAARKKSAKAFEKAIQSELNDLAMERTTVRIAIDDADESQDGIDRVDVLIAPNRGEEPKPMQRIASGGELSRIQLAIAAALFKKSGRGAAATLVFDEIDAGIGGRVAEVVGRKLEELAARNQVVCVTHLPQIASFGTTHFVVWKEDAGGHTRARVRRLDGDEERVHELARMLGGESIAPTAVLHARELLEASRR
jgi:DNA repair protein RecN (Recombination protein N)